MSATATNHVETIRQSKSLFRPPQQPATLRSRTQNCKLPTSASAEPNSPEQQKSQHVPRRQRAMNLNESESQSQQQEVGFTQQDLVKLKQYAKKAKRNLNKKKKRKRKQLISKHAHEDRQIISQIASFWFCE